MLDSSLQQSYGVFWKVLDKLFWLATVVVSILVGMALMQAISNYKNQEEVDAAISGLSSIKIRK